MKPRQVMLSTLFILGVLFAVAGPVIATLTGLPNPDEVLGRPFETSPGLLGTDRLGRDVVARALHGNGGLLVLSTITAVAATLVGAAVGIVTAWMPSLRKVVQVVTDVLMTIPPIVLVLLAATVGNGSAVVIGVVTVVLSVPVSSRYFEAICTPLLHSGFIDIARSEGRAAWSITITDVIPLLRSALLTELAVRFTAAVYLVSTVSFLGGGTGGGGSDWASSLRSGIEGVTLNPWGVVAPAVGIALLSVPPSLLADRSGEETL